MNKAKSLKDLNYTLLLEEQIELLWEWNKKNINTEPEQVRRNIETIIKYYECKKSIIN